MKTTSDLTSSEGFETLDDYNPKVARLVDSAKDDGAKELDIQDNEREVARILNLLTGKRESANRDLYDRVVNRNDESLYDRVVNRTNESQYDDVDSLEPDVARILKLLTKETSTVESTYPVPETHEQSSTAIGDLTSSDTTDTQASVSPKTPPVIGNLTSSDTTDTQASVSPMTPSVIGNLTSSDTEASLSAPSPKRNPNRFDFCPKVFDSVVFPDEHWKEIGQKHPTSISLNDVAKITHASRFYDGLMECLKRKERDSEEKVPKTSSSYTTNRVSTPLRPASLSTNPTLDRTHPDTRIGLALRKVTNREEKLDMFCNQLRQEFDPNRDSTNLYAMKENMSLGRASKKALTSWIDIGIPANREDIPVQVVNILKIEPSSEGPIPTMFPAVPFSKTDLDPCYSFIHKTQNKMPTMIIQVKGTVNKHNRVMVTRKSVTESGTNSNYSMAMINKVVQGGSQFRVMVGDYITFGLNHQFNFQVVPTGIQAEPFPSTACISAVVQESKSPSVSATAIASEGTQECKAPSAWDVTIDDPNPSYVMPEMRYALSILSPSKFNVLTTEYSLGSKGNHGLGPHEMVINAPSVSSKRQRYDCALTSTSQDTIPYDASSIESEAALGNHMGNVISEPKDYNNSWKAKRLQKTLVKERLASNGGGYTPWGRPVHGENAWKCNESLGNSAAFPQPPSDDSPDDETREYHRLGPHEMAINAPSAPSKRLYDDDVQKDPWHPNNLSLEKVDEIVELQLEKDKTVEPKPLSKFGERNLSKLPKDSNDGVVEPPAKCCGNPNCLQPLDWKSNGYLRKDENGDYIYCCYCTECQKVIDAKKYLKNKDKISAYNLKNKAKKKAYDAKHILKNKAIYDRNNAKTSAKLKEQKSADWKIVASGSESVTPEKTPEEIARLWDDIAKKEPMLSLLKPESQGSFYLAFARSDRKEIEPYMFISREDPPLRHKNGKKITHKQFKAQGFRVEMLHEERNYLNVGELERHAHTETKTLDFGRRLNRKCGGFPAVNDDSKTMEHGLYVCFNDIGYSNGGKSGFKLVNKKKSV